MIHPIKIMELVYKMSLSLEDYDFEVPDELIAQQPCKKRSGSKLLVYRPESALIDSQFENLDQHIPENSLLILNDSKVFSSRVFGQKKESGARVELLLLTAPSGSSPCTCTAIAKPIKKLKAGSKIECKDGLIFEVLEIVKRENSLPVLKLILLNTSEEEALLWLEKNGQTPLPPYIKRDSIKATKKTAQDIKRPTLRKQGLQQHPQLGFILIRIFLINLKKRK